MKQSVEQTRGRLIAIETLQSGEQQLLIQNERGTHRCVVSSSQASLKPMVGDIVQVSPDSLKILTRNRSAQKTSRWMERTLAPRRLHALQVRDQVEEGIRRFFRSQEFHEVRTPLLVPSPGMEPHIRPFQVKAHTRSTQLEAPVFLPTSPEFAMKRLLAGGLEKIFQICSSFRHEPNSSTHHPEFTMLEWYRAYDGYESIMADAEQMYAEIATRIFGAPKIRFQGREIDLTPPWPRLRIRDLFLEMVGVDLVRSSTPKQLAEECRRLGLSPGATDTWDDLYFKIWMDRIEPKLPADRAVFVHGYPPSQAALANLETLPDGTLWAKRFEFYIGGLELGNGFDELTEPNEQRKRFIEDMELRSELYGDDFPKSPLDEGFLSALEEGMPPSGGVAMGVDRMIMLFADEPEIDYTLWLPSFWEEKA